MSKQEIITEDMKKRWKKKIQFCIDYYHRLNAWEQAFIDDTEIYFARHNYLTWKHSKKLNEIYERIL
jgi:hypothetical protein